MTPRAFALFLRNRAVRHARRMADQRFDAAEAFGEAEIRQAAREIERALRPRPSSIEGKHAAEAAHLAPRELVLRMRRQAGIVDALDVVARLRGTRRSFGRCARARACARRASWRRASSARHRAARERRRRRSART